LQKRIIIIETDLTYLIEREGNPMKEDSQLMIIIRNITLWRAFKVIAIITLISVVFSVVAEAYMLKQAFVWVKDRILKLTWKSPASGCDHYRLEISQTNLLEEPVTTYFSYAYLKNPDFQIELQDDHSYMFRVQAVSSYGVLSDFSDSTSLFIYQGEETACEEELDVIPMEFALSQNYPNPFNLQTNIEYQISGSGAGRSGTRVHLAIYNVLGQCVRVLVDEPQAPGKYSMTWDGQNDAGQVVTTGHYIYQLTAGKFRASKKMLCLK